MDDDGNALVLWGISNGTEGTLWSARFERGSGWGSAERVAIDPIRPVGSTRLAMTRDGRAVAVWALWGANRIQAFRYDRSAGWRQAEEIAPAAGNGGRMPAVAAGRNGEFIAVWVEPREGNTSRLWSNHFDGARWGGAERLPSSEPATLWWPEVAMDDQGNTLAIWVEDPPAPEGTLVYRGTLLSSYRPARP